MTVMFPFLLLLISAVYARSTLDQVHIQLLNKCRFPLFPSFQSDLLPNSNGWAKMEWGDSRDMYVPYTWKGMIWARTSCDENMNCLTGHCGNSLNCNGTEPNYPVTKAYLQLNRAGSDYYYISFLDGHNVPITIQPMQNGSSACPAAGECEKDINRGCPDELIVAAADGGTVGCMSGCNKFKTDRFCCSHGYDNMMDCWEEAWPANYPGFFKEACPNAQSYKYDWQGGRYVHTCAGANLTYLIRFC